MRAHYAVHGGLKDVYHFDCTELLPHSHFSVRYGIRVFGCDSESIYRDYSWTPSGSKNLLIDGLAFDRPMNADRYPV